jgi:hypothetical protein
MPVVEFNGNGRVQVGRRWLTAAVLVGADGNPLGDVDVYRAATGGTFATPADTWIWGEVRGSSTRRVGVRSIRVMGANASAVAYAALKVSRRAASTGGTSLALAIAKLSSSDAPDPTCSVLGFSAAPTPGTDGNALAARILHVQSSTAAAAGALYDAVIDFTSPDAPHGVVLADDTEAIALSWANAPANAVSVALEFEIVEF